jgi:spermidine/putrescine transport system ATP-binding protein
MPVPDTSAMQSLEGAHVASPDDDDERPVMLDLAGVTKAFGKRKNAIFAVDELDLQIHQGEYFSIVGPSGCGKTTLLRLIAGLDVPRPGTIHIDQQDVTRAPAHKRPVNMVFQNYALFPHMTVYHNIAFALTIRKYSADQIEKEVNGALELFKLHELVDRKPKQLSGGEQQRVALARALVNEPKVLLLDEPLAALDSKFRREIQHELRALHQNLQITFVHVTHDQEEALALSDRVAVMNHGRIEQIDTPNRLYEHPANPFVAGFIGDCNIFDSKFLFREGPEVVVQTEIGRVRSHFPHSDAERADQNQIKIAIRPEKIIIEAGKTERDNTFYGTIREVKYQGATTHLAVSHNDRIVRVSMLNSMAALPQLRLGDQISFFFPPENLLLMES